MHRVDILLFPSDNVKHLASVHQRRVTASLYLGANDMFQFPIRYFVYGSLIIVTQKAHSITGYGTKAGYRQHGFQLIKFIRAGWPTKPVDVSGGLFEAREVLLFHLTARGDLAFG